MDEQEQAGVDLAMKISKGEALLRQRLHDLEAIWPRCSA